MILLLTMGCFGIVLILFIVLYFYGKINAKKNKGENVDPTEPGTKANDLPGNSFENRGDAAKSRFKDALLKMLNDKRTYINLGGQILLSGFVEKVVEKVDEKIVKKQIMQSGRRTINKAAERSTERMVERLSVKAVEKTAERAAIKAAAQIGSKAAVAAKTGPAAPAVMAGELVFGYVSGIMDGLNLGGFNNMKTQEMFGEMRKNIDDDFNKLTGGTPIVYGPFNIMFEDDLYNQIVDTMIDLALKDANAQKQISLESFDSYIDAALNKICVDKGGFMTPDKKCSFTQTNCLANWPINTGDTYYEFKDGVCQVQPGLMREFCEKIGLGVYYDLNTRGCVLTDEYCRRYGASGVVNGDCQITDGQAFAEAVFGTTVVRGLANIFDPDNYMPCTGDWKPFPSIPGIPKGSNMFENYFCTKDDPLRIVAKVCPRDMKQVGLHCYDKNVDTTLLVKGGTLKDCDPGQRDDGTSCWDDLKCDTWCDSHWNWDDGGFCHTRCKGCGCIKKNRFDRLMCPNGYYKFGGMCYARSQLVEDVGTCPTGTKPSHGPYCVNSITKVKERRVPLPSTTEEDIKNSSIGRQFNCSINGARNGDAKEFMRCAYGASLVTNPLVVSLGFTDLVSMGWDQTAPPTSQT